MPVYEYACDKCGHEFEREQRITEDPVKTCPECRGRKVRRLISRTAFVLKGGGWYSDLYSSSKPETGGDGDKDGKADKGDKAEKTDKGGKADKKSAESGASGKSSGKGKSKGKGPKAAA
ncbi:MAG: zinc ribbon domain-containing protein [Myxococcota bacterium]|nr:zinc ribbon domain-containing protein [Myxococcota bacterium]